jgi:hypothetical protein
LSHLFLIARRLRFSTDQQIEIEKWSAQRHREADLSWTTVAWSQGRRTAR